MQTQVGASASGAPKQKATPDVAPIAAHGLQGCCSVLRARGSGRQRDTPAPSERGFSSPRHQANCTLLIVISVLSNTSILAATLESGWTQPRKSDSTSVSTHILTTVTR